MYQIEKADFNSIIPQKDVDVLSKMLREDYSYSDQSMSKNIKLNLLSFPLDLAIFRENNPHTIDNLFMVCDTSSNTVDDCLNKMKQLSIFVIDDFYIIFYKNGDMQIFRYCKNEDVIEPFYIIPNYYKKDLILFKKDLVFTDDLSRIIEIIHNHIYANEGFSTNEVFNELIKILMVKYIDEQKNSNDRLEFYISEDEIDDLHSNKDTLFCNRINKLYKEVTINYPDLFSKDDILNLSPEVLAFTVAQLQRYNLFDMDNDIKGLIFQKVINNSQKGERGQFFTPDPIISFMVNFIKPQKHELVLDPACGTGGFLRQVISYMRKKSLKEDDIQTYIYNNVFGIEINPSISRVANLRFVFEGCETSNVLCYNSLSKFENYNNVTNCRKNNIRFEKGSYDLILTNPPFGSQGKITDKTLLSNFDLGHKWNGKKTSRLLTGQVPDILFIERCIDLLKDNGRLGIILPDGDLENPSLEYVRRFIKDKCKILAVIKLPDQAFIPFGTGVKASILFLEKKEQFRDDKNYKIFFAKIDRLGYAYNKNASLTYKKDLHGKLILDEDGMPMIDEDYTEIIKHYEKFISTGEIGESEKCFIVDSRDISGRFDFEFYEPKYVNNIKKLKKLGAIPLSSVVKIVKGKDKLLKEKDKIVKYVEISDISPVYSEIVSCSEMPVHQLPSRASFKICTGDIITSVSGNAIGTSKHASAIVTEEYNGSICTNGFRVLKPFAVDPYYLLYYLRSEFFLSQILRLRTGAAIPSISDEDFNNILIFLPNREISESIGEKIKESYELRLKAREILNIDFNSFIDQNILT